MKKICTLSVLFLAASLSLFAGNERLIGTWKSNKDAMLAYLKIHTKLTPEQLDALAPLLGKMTFIMDNTNITMQLGDWKFTSRYKIISETKDAVTIESQDPSTHDQTKTILELDATGFWTPDDKIRDYKERFDKTPVK
jgi:hypothetical protein